MGDRVLDPEIPLSTRYLHKLSAGVVVGATRVAATALIPRSLGPAAYGDFSFLTRFFTEMWDFLSLGTPLCFYTKLSQRPGEVGLIRFYWSFFLGVAAVTPLLVLVIDWTGLQEWVWPGQETPYIWMALVWALLGAATVLLNHFVDAYGFTVEGEKTRTYRRILGLILVLVVFLNASRDLWVLFVYHYWLLLFLCI